MSSGEKSVGQVFKENKRLAREAEGNARERFGKRLSNARERLNKGMDAGRRIWGGLRNKTESIARGAGNIAMDAVSQVGVIDQQIGRGLDAIGDRAEGFMMNRADQALVTADKAVNVVAGVVDRLNRRGDDREELKRDRDAIQALRKNLNEGRKAIMAGKAELRNMTKGASPENGFAGLASSLDHATETFNKNVDDLQELKDKYKEKMKQRKQNSSVLAGFRNRLRQGRIGLADRAANAGKNNRDGLNDLSGVNFQEVPENYYMEPYSNQIDTDKKTIAQRLDHLVTSDDSEVEGDN